GDAYETQEFHRFLGDAFLFSSLPGQLQERLKHCRFHADMAPDPDVVEARHVVEEPDVLKSPRDSPTRNLVRLEARDIATVEHDASARRLEETSHVVEQSGLAGAVGADQRENLATLDVETHVVHRDETAEALGQVGQLEDVVVRRRLLAHVACSISTAASSSWTAACLSSCSRIRLGSRPWGRNSIIATRMAP